MASFLRDLFSQRGSDDESDIEEQFMQSRSKNTGNDHGHLSDSEDDDYDEDTGDGHQRSRSSSRRKPVQGYRSSSRSPGSKRRKRKDRLSRLSSSEDEGIKSIGDGGSRHSSHSMRSTSHRMPSPIRGDRSSSRMRFSHGEEYQYGFFDNGNYDYEYLSAREGQYQALVPPGPFWAPAPTQAYDSTHPLTAPPNSGIEGFYAPNFSSTQPSIAIQPNTQIAERPRDKSTLSRSGSTARRMPSPTRIRNLFLRRSNEVSSEIQDMSRRLQPSWSINDVQMPLNGRSVHRQPHPSFTETSSLAVPIPSTLHQRSPSAEEIRNMPANDDPSDSLMIEKDWPPAGTNAPAATLPYQVQRVQNQNVSFPVSSSSHNSLHIVQPEDSLSNNGQLDSIQHAWSSNRASTALSDSTLVSKQLPSSSGILGIKTYQYSPLHESEFRLINILPKTTSKIKCEIRHYSLANPPEYIAISYAWGDADDTEKIILEGATIPVTVSLHGALRALREKNKNLLVWVDALCIDQQNKDERTQQVLLMTGIYSRAVSIAIWLGPEADNSRAGTKFLEEVAQNASSEQHVKTLLVTHHNGPEIPALVSLFERDYWKRLWVVQEIFNARVRVVYCGSSKLPWEVYETAAKALKRHKHQVDLLFPGNVVHGRDQRASASQFSYSQVLAYLGPNGFPDVASLMNLSEGVLLEVMCACRDKLTADPRDKLFGILGILPEHIRKEFTVDYGLSIKEVYYNVADNILHTTDRLDVICEAIHFPIHTSATNLPTWVPNWDYITPISAMGRSFRFSAAGDSIADFEILKAGRKLRISAISIGTIDRHGIAVGTLCTLADYLMAFLHWRALLLGTIDKEDEGSRKANGLQEAFCRTLCLGQVPSGWDHHPQKWMRACYHVFASLIHDRLPHLPLDRELQSFLDTVDDIKPGDRRHFLQQHFGNRMFGRCFCTTTNRLIGMGSGFMAADDIVVVPLGCSTPIILRREGRGEYRFVGDVYIHGFMEGLALDELNAGVRERELREYILH